MAGSNLFGSLGQLVKGTAGRIVIAVAAVVLVAGAVAGVMYFRKATPQAPAPPVAVQHARPAAHAATAAPQVANASAQPGAGPTIVPVRKSPGLPVRPVVAEGNGTPVVTAVTQGSVAPAPNQAHLSDHLTYQYNELGRRDPFQSLVDGAFVGADVGGDAPPDPGGVKVVGIVWGASDQFALVEDVRGNSFVLRKGDKVQNGYVEGLKRDGVIVNITAEGQSQSVVIPLVRKGEHNAR